MTTVVKVRVEIVCPGKRVHAQVVGDPGGKHESNFITGQGEEVTAVLYGNRRLVVTEEDLPAGDPEKQAPEGQEDPPADEQGKGGAQHPDY